MRIFTGGFVLMPPMYLLGWFLSPGTPLYQLSVRNPSLRNCPDPDCHATSGDIQYGLDSPTCIVLVPDRVKYASMPRRDALLVVRMTRSRYMRAPCRPAMPRPGSLFRRRRWRRALSVLLWTACVACLCGGRAAEMTCRACPDGSYLNQTAVSCAECPAHSRVPGPANASSVLACECEAAHTPSATACEPCALASYKGALGNVSCTLCPANTNTTARGGVALAECLCAPGFFLDASACAPCAAGSFKGHVGNEACAPCPVDTYCPAQSIAPVPCVGNSSRLTEGGQTVRDCLCLPGFRYTGPAARKTASKTYPTTALVLTTEADGYILIESKVANYVDTWDDEGYTVRVKSSEAQSHGRNGALWDGQSGPPFFIGEPYKFEHFNPWGYYGATRFKGVAGALTLLDMGRDILPTSMVLQARMTANIGFAPGLFKIYASNTPEDWTATNTETWIQLYHQSVTATYSSTGSTQFDVTTDTAYQYYALHILNTVSQPQLFLAEWDIIGTSTEDDFSRMCTPCPVGSFNAEFNQTACSACPQDSFNSHRASSNVSACLACDPNAAAPEGSSRSTACRCNVGYAGGFGASCVACPAGRYASLDLPLPLVYDFAAMSTLQEWRAYARTFATIANFEYMNPSTLGIYGAHAREASITYVLSDKYDTVEVRIANINQASYVNVYLCRTSSGGYACTLGASAGPRTTRTYTTQYLPGDTLFVNEESAVMGRGLRITTTKSADLDLLVYICAECPADTYNAELAVVSIAQCHACPPNTTTQGRHGSGGRGDCACRPGFRAYDRAGARPCAPCGAGRLQMAHNASSCLRCAPGTYSAAPAAESIATCMACAAGSFATSDASSHCELCPADKWQDLRARDAKSQRCERCPRNSSTRDAGRRHVTTGASNVPTGASNVTTGAFNVSACVCAIGLRLAPGSLLAGGLRTRAPTAARCARRGASARAAASPWRVRSTRGRAPASTRGRASRARPTTSRSPPSGCAGPPCASAWPAPGAPPTARARRARRARTSRATSRSGASTRTRTPRRAPRGSRGWGSGARDCDQLRAVSGQLLQQRLGRGGVHGVPRQRLGPRRQQQPPAL